MHTARRALQDADFSTDRAICLLLRMWYMQPLVACADKRKDALVRRGSPFQTDIEFLHASILTTSWENGDVVFCHGTCFSDKCV